MHYHITLPNVKASHKSQEILRGIGIVFEYDYYNTISDSKTLFIKGHTLYTDTWSYASSTYNAKKIYFDQLKSILHE